MPRLPATVAERSVVVQSNLGAWVRETRLSQGISQRGLAERAGLSRSYLCDIELGRGAQPSVATFDKLAAALGASRADLLRAAGVLDPIASPHEQAGERRLLSLFRDLGPAGQEAVERFARFVHIEEHRWVQPALLNLDGEDGDDSVRSGVPHQRGPGLFDGLPLVPMNGHAGHRTRTGRSG